MATHDATADGPLFKLFYGDNLPIMRDRDHFPSNSVDVIYADPPFNSQRAYNLCLRDDLGHIPQSQIRTFDDTWTFDRAARDDLELVRRERPDIAIQLDFWIRLYRPTSLVAYLCRMAPRLIECHRVLTDCGSIGLHCDPLASRYLSVLLDMIFGVENRRGPIFWRRSYAHNDARRKMASIVDEILYYAKTAAAPFNQQYTPHSAEYIKKEYRHILPDGRRYKLSDARSPQPRPNLVYDYKGYKPHPNGWATTYERMEELDQAGLLEFPTNKGGRIQRRTVLTPGKPLTNLWLDVPPISANSPERTGFQTQKPVALVERFIAMTSSHGQLLLDPFCGCGTSGVAAYRIGRKYIGIDITYLALQLVKDRLTTAQQGGDMFSCPTTKLRYAEFGVPHDLDDTYRLAKENPYEFQYFCTAKVGAQPYQGKRKGADSGIDGIRYIPCPDGDDDRLLVSVKSGNVNLSQIRDFGHVINRENARIGVFIAFEFTEKMRIEAAGMGRYRGAPRMQLLTLQDIFAGKREIVPDYSMSV